MAVATFDTLKFANTLKAAGVPDKQAEAQAVALAEVVQANVKDLATKEDVDRAAKLLAQEFNVKVEALAARLANDLVAVKWMLGITLTCVLCVLVRVFFIRSA